MAVWFATAALATAILIFAPQLLLKNNYAQHDVLLVTLITSLIMLVQELSHPARDLHAGGR